MSKSRAWLAGCLVWCGSVAGASAAPPVSQMMQFQPRQPGIVCTIPTADEQKTCKVKLVTGTRTGASGWMLEDARGLALRKFFDSNGDKRIDVWSYYKDGAEVYRETDTNFNDRADQYRWFNAGGMKWGVDVNEDGKIDGWKMISAEEVGQEVFQAAIQRDLGRLQALFITDAELRAVKLPASRVEQSRAAIREAGKRLQATLDKMPSLNDKAQFVHVETATPQCVPDSGNDEELIQYPSRSILFQTADQKHNWLHTGEMVKIGLAWRLLDVPSNQEPSSSTTPNGTTNPTPMNTSPEAQKLLDLIAGMDKSPPTPPQNSEPHPATVRYNIERAQLVEKVLPMLPSGQDRGNWIKQLFDNYGTAAQYSDTAKDKRAITRLKELRDQAAKDQSAATIVPYADFRIMWAEYAPKMSGTPEEVKKSQEKWLDQLAKFVQTYPRAEDTPDALWHLAMTCEFSGKDDESKRWYQQLASNFGEHHLAKKAAGAKRRLEIVGQPMELHGPTIEGSPFDIARLKGKVVVVYYWASFCSNCPADFSRFKQLQSTYASKGLELVLINLDDQKEVATQFLRSNPVPGTHLFEAAEGGGLNSPLAVHFGIQALPTLFVVGKDGKVISRSLQVNDLEETIRKAL